MKIHNTCGPDCRNAAVQYTTIMDHINTYTNTVIDTNLNENRNTNLNEYTQHMWTWLQQCRSALNYHSGLYKYKYNYKYKCRYKFERKYPSQIYVAMLQCTL